MEEKDTISISWAGVTSEWGLQKFRDAINNPLVTNLFSLNAASGRATSAQETESAICKKFSDREDIKEFARLIGSGAIKYYPYQIIDEQTNVPQELLNTPGSALYISSNNTNHLHHITNGINARVHTLFEKPCVVVLNARGEVSPKQIDALEKILRTMPKGVILMDAEHYAYKEQSLTFYKEQKRILHGRKIVGIDGRIIETDKPDKKRNLDLLKLEERTGLFTDTGVHLISFITNLGGRAIPENAFYGLYPGYQTETSAEVEYRIEPDKDSPFREDARAFFRVEKFTDRKRIKGAEDKKVTFYLEDKGKIELTFGKSGKVKEIFPDGTENPIVSQSQISSNEYVNILSEFHNAIKTRRQPITSGENSLRTMRSIYETYLKCSPTDPRHRRNIYESN